MSISQLLLLGTVGLFPMLTGAQNETTLLLPQDTDNKVFRFLPNKSDWRTGEYGENNTATNCGQWTSLAGASVEIHFYGDYFQIYGDIPGDKSAVSATLDAKTPLNITGDSTRECEELMWQADPSTLPLGHHTIVATHIGAPDRPLVIDRVVFGNKITAGASSSLTGTTTSTTTTNPNAIAPASPSSLPSGATTSSALIDLNPILSSLIAGAATSTVSNSPTAIPSPVVVPWTSKATSSITPSGPNRILPPSTLPLSSEPSVSATSAVPTAPPNDSLNGIPSNTDGGLNESTQSAVSSTQTETITTPSPESMVAPVDNPTPASGGPTAFVPSENSQALGSNPGPSSDPDSNTGRRSGSPPSATDQPPPLTSPDNPQTSSPAASSTSPSPSTSDPDDKPPGTTQSNNRSDPVQLSNTPSVPARSSATSSPDGPSSGNQGDSDRSRSPPQPSSSSSTHRPSNNTPSAHEASPVEATISTARTPNLTMTTLHSENTSMAQVVASGSSAQQGGPTSTTDLLVVGSSQFSSVGTPSRTPEFPTSLAPLASASSSQSVTPLMGSIAKPSAINPTSTGVTPTNSSSNSLPIDGSQGSHKHRVAVITGSTVAGALASGVLIACAAYAAKNREWIYYLVGSTLFALGGTGFGYHARRLRIKRGRGINLPDTKIALIVTAAPRVVLDRNTIIWHANIVSETCNQFLVDVPCSHKEGSMRLFFGTFTDEGSRAIVDSCAEAPAVIREEQGNCQWHHDQPSSSSSKGSEPPATARNETSVPLSIVLGTGTKVSSKGSHTEKDPNMIPFLQIPEESFRSGDTYEAPTKLYLHAYRVPSDCESGQFGDRLNASHILRDSLTGGEGIEIDKLKPLTTWTIKPGKEGELKLEIGSNDHEDIRQFRHECKIRKSAEFIRGAGEGYSTVGPNTEVA